jgi:hypothetical protein
MNKQAQLTPAMAANKWKKGQPSPNPTGRPKKKPVTESYESIITEKLPDALRTFRLGRSNIELKAGATFADLLALGQVISATKGNTAAAAEIANRIEAKVAQPVTGADGGPIKWEIEVIGTTRSARPYPQDTDLITTEAGRAPGISSGTARPLHRG